MKNLKFFCLFLISLVPGLSKAQIVGVTVQSAPTGVSARVSANMINNSGLTGGSHSQEANDMYLTSILGGLPLTIIFDLGANYDVSGIHIWNYFEGGAEFNAQRGSNAVTISYDVTTGGSSFTSIGNFSFAKSVDNLGSNVGTTAMSNARLIKFDVTSTHGSATWLGLSEVQFTEASAVPEPSSYAAIAGLAVMGFVASRRRRIS